MKINTKTIITTMAIFASSALMAHSQKIFSHQQTFPFNSDGRTLEGVAKNTIYLTFDDGPTSVATPTILDLLKEYKIKATFFMVGKMAKAHQSLVAEIRASGHRVASHSYSHELSFTSGDDFIDTLITTDNVIADYMEDSDIRLFRAPGGNWHDYQALAANANEVTKKYVGPIYWNVGGGNGSAKDDADWKCWSTWYVTPKRCGKSYLEQIESNYRNGRPSIVLMHDINRKSADMLEYILKKLSKSKINWKFDLIENIPSVRAMNK